MCSSVISTACNAQEAAMAELRDKMLAEGILVGVLSKYLDNKPTYYRFCQVIFGHIDSIRD